MKKYFLIALGVLLLNSCATTLLTDKDVSPAEVKNISYHEPISFINLIEKGNQAKLNDSLSHVSTVILDSIIKNSGHPKVSKRLDVTEQKLKMRLENDLLKTVSEIRKVNKLEAVKTTALMDSVVKSENQRFALFVINSGFARRKNNYGNQIVKGIGVGILTMGMYTPVPIKATTSTYAMIYDAQKSSVVFFNYLPAIERSPVDKKNMSNIYSLLFDKYYNAEKNR